MHIKYRQQHAQQMTRPNISAPSNIHGMPPSSSWSAASLLSDEGDGDGACDGACEETSEGGSVVGLSVLDGDSVGVADGLALGVPLGCSLGAGDGH